MKADTIIILAGGAVGLYGLSRIMGGANPLKDLNDVVNAGRAAKDFIDKAEETVDLILMDQMTDAQGNEELIQAYEAQGMTGQKIWNMYLRVQAGTLNDPFNLFDPATKPAEFFVNQSTELGNSSHPERLTAVRGWLLDQFDIYMAFYNNYVPMGKQKP